MIAPAYVLHAEQAAPVAPFSESRDVIDDALKAMHLGYALTGNEREAFIRALERLRDDLSPTVRAPRRMRARISNKARRRAVLAINRVIDEGRAFF